MGFGFWVLAERGLRFWVLVGLRFWVLGYDGFKVLGFGGFWVLGFGDCGRNFGLGEILDLCKFGGVVANSPGRSGRHAPRVRARASRSAVKRDRMM